MSLLSENPWAVEFAPHFTGPSFEAARARASVRLVSGGANAVTAWAEAMRSRSTAPHHCGRDAAWRALATIDLAGDFVGQSLDLAACDFPSDVIIRQVDARGDLFMDAARVGGSLKISDSHFSRSAQFQSLQVKESVLISDTTFGSRTDFTRARLEADAQFNSVTFERDVWFREATFQGAAGFRDCVFGSDAGFLYARFEAGALFERVRFLDTVSFQQSAFRGAVQFDTVTTAGRVWSDGATTTRARDALVLKALSSSPIALPSHEGVEPEARRRGA